MAFTSLLRPACCVRLIDSVAAHAPWLRVVVALQGTDHELEARLADRQGVEAFTIEADAGLSRARNLLFDRVDSDYVLIVDDDVVLHETTDIATGIAFLDAHPEVAVVGGGFRRELRVTNREGGSDGLESRQPRRFEFFFDRLSRGSLEMTSLGLEYGEHYAGDSSRLYAADVVFNLALIRRSVVVDEGVRWDDSIKVWGEHLDWFQSLNESGRNRVVYYAGLSFDHLQERNEDYLQRRRRRLGQARMLDKRGYFRRVIQRQRGEKIVDYRYLKKRTSKPYVKLGFGTGELAARRLRRNGLLRLPKTLSRLVAEERLRRRLCRQHADRFEHNVYVDRDRRFLWVQCPKSACTFIKQVLSDAELGGERNWQDVDVHTDHALVVGSELSPKKLTELLFSDRVLRFAFVRNPFARALSSYLHRVLEVPEIASVRTAALKVDMRLSAGLDPRAEVPFVDFLRYVAHQPDHLRDPHWRGQAESLMLPIVDYEMVGHVEAIERDLGAVLERIAPDHVGLAEAAATNVRNALALIDDYYDVDECVDLVRTIYARDFEIFGYSRDPAASTQAPR